MFLRIEGGMHRAFIIAGPRLALFTMYKIGDGGLNR